MKNLTISKVILFYLILNKVADIFSFERLKLSQFLLQTAEKNRNLPQSFAELFAERFAVYIIH